MLTTVPPSAELSATVNDVPTMPAARLESNSSSSSSSSSSGDSDSASGCSVSSDEEYYQMPFWYYNKIRKRG